MTEYENRRQEIKRFMNTGFEMLAIWTEPCSPLTCMWITLTVTNRRSRSDSGQNQKTKPALVLVSLGKRKTNPGFCLVSSALAFQLG